MTDRTPDMQPVNPLHRRFGVRVSTLIPEFQVGNAMFQTRILVVGEDRALSQVQTRIPQAEDGVDLTPEQQDATLTGMVEIMTQVLRPRFLRGAEGDLNREDIDAEWMMNNLTSNDIGPILYLLRRGEYQPEDALGDAEDPNADL